MDKKNQSRAASLVSNIEANIEELKALIGITTADDAGSEDGDFDPTDIPEMTFAELKAQAKLAGIPGFAKLKEKQLRETLAAHYDTEEEEEEEEADEAEDEEGEVYTEEELDELSDADLKEIATDNEIEIPIKKKKLDRPALIAAILEAQEDGEEEEEDDEEETEEVDYESMDDDELVEAAEEAEVDPVYTGKGTKKKLDREATIAALEESSEEEDEEEEEDDTEDEGGLATYAEADLDKLKEAELKAHLVELSEQADDYGLVMPKGWAKLVGTAKLKKAILDIYAQEEDDEEEEE